MAPLEVTGKQKASRIPLDYHKRPDLLARVRFWLGLLALMVAGGWAFFAMRDPVSALSPGPVATVHATWEHKCEACHVPFFPSRADAVDIASLLGKPGVVTDEKCQACHRGPAHHAAQISGQMDRCSACHTEHQGRNTPIARTDDRACIDCHADLVAHSSRPQTLITSGPFASASITSFGLETHPQFRSTVSDPGKLKFSHRRHLAPGLNLGAEDRFPAQRLKDLAPEDRARYRVTGQDDDDVIRLACADCHRLNAATQYSGSDKNRRLMQPATGAYMLPIRYETDCQACHRLNYEPESNPAKSNILPHGLEPAEIEQFLQAVYTKAFLDSDAAFSKPTVADDRLPGKPAFSESPAAKAFIREQVTRADTYLRGRCQECHELSGMPTKAAITPTQVPNIWLNHAQFDHSAHRAVACRVCHQQDYLYQPRATNMSWPALDNQDILMPRLDVCVQCHAPPGKTGSGGARYDCVECHIYHAADRPGGVRGNTTRGALRRLQLEEFLHGGVPPRKAP